MKENIHHHNIAFLDGQNIHMSTRAADSPWRIDLARFRVYLSQKYNVEKAYYFLIEENRFEKILFPDFKRASSLYKQITRKYCDGLDRNGVKEKIAKRKGGLR